MKKTGKKFNYIAIFVLFIVTILAVGITYSYFTFKQKVQSEITLGSIKVNYLLTDSTSTTKTIDSTTEMQLYTLDPISRGSEFSLYESSTDADPLSLIGFQKESGTTDVYIRFWIDAYLINDGVEDKSVNYGEYFDILFGDSVIDESSSGVVKSVSESGLVTYFIENKVTGDVGCFTKMKLKSDVPFAMLNSSYRLYLSFDAVQASNQAYLSVFEGSSRGYCSSWS